MSSKLSKIGSIIVLALAIVIIGGSLSCVKGKLAPISKIGAKELEEAVEVLGNSIPLPHYLPPGYKIQRALCPKKEGSYYIEGYGTKRFWRVTLLISDKEIEGPISRDMLEWVNKKIGLFEVAGKRGIQLDIVQWEGYPFSLEAYAGSPPDEVPPPEKFFDGMKGYFCSIDSSYLVIWNLPNWDKPEFVLGMLSSQEVSREELIKIAKSIKLPK